MDLGELLAIFGPGISGAVFGTGWWFWVDAVVCSSVVVPFVHYLPGIFASLAALMFNCVKKEDIDYSPYEDGEWRLRYCTQLTNLEQEIAIFNEYMLNKLPDSLNVFNVEALAFHCICGVFCLAGCISRSIGTRCTCGNGAFIMDRSCRHTSMCFCTHQWSDLLDFSFRITWHMKSSLTKLIISSGIIRKCILLFVFCFFRGEGEIK